MSLVRETLCLFELLAIVVARVHYCHSLSVASSLVTDGFRSAEETFSRARVCKCSYILSLLSAGQHFILWYKKRCLVLTRVDITLSKCWQPTQIGVLHVVATN